MTLRISMYLMINYSIYLNDSCIFVICLFIIRFLSLVQEKRDLLSKIGLNCLSLFFEVTPLQHILPFQPPTEGLPLIQNSFLICWTFVKIIIAQKVPRNKDKINTSKILGLSVRTPNWGCGYLNWSISETLWNWWCRSQASSSPLEFQKKNQEKKKKNSGSYGGFAAEDAQESPESPEMRSQGEREKYSMLYIIIFKILHELCSLFIYLSIELIYVKKWTPIYSKLDTIKYTNILKS